MHKKTIKKGGREFGPYFYKLIKSGESERAEFKTSLSEWKEAIKTLAAFSWLKGGMVIFGVSRSKKIIGIDLGKGTLEKLANDIKQNTDPKLYPSIEASKANGRSIIMVETEKTSDEPVLAFGRPYKRVGKATHLMSRDEYKRVIRRLYEQEFDGLICKEAALEDIDWVFVKEFFIPRYESLTEAKVAGKPKDLLETLGCIKNNRPTNAGILLFGKNPQKFFMNSYVALARYKEGIGTERLDYKEFNGNIFQQIDKTDEYIKEHIAVMSRLHPMKVEREDIPEYPLFSVRELVTNAVCHRDYSEQGSKVIIKMFGNYIEFYNPGGLAKDITPKNITRKQFSRNPVIAKVLSKIKYIEELGEGWDKIIKEHKKHALRPRLPKISADKSSVLVTLFSTKEKFERKKEMLALNERQKRALEFVKKEGRITNKDYRGLIPGIADKTVFRDLQSLVNKKIIAPRGKKKGRYYVLIK